ncbi:MAG: HAMP domain-containing protein, partial [Cyanobacteria bacterium P01_D01_bin.1]
MASATDYAQSYQAAERAYMQGSFEAAAQAIDLLADDYPSDPSVLLLKGHIYCYGLQQYEIAQQQYKSVLQLSSDPEFVDYANNGLAYASQSVHQNEEPYLEENGLEDTISPMPEEFDDGLVDPISEVDISPDNNLEENEADVAAWSGETETEAHNDDDLDAFGQFDSGFSADFDSNDIGLDSSQASGTNPFEFSADQQSEVETEDFFPGGEDSSNPFSPSSAVDDSFEDDPLIATLDDPFVMPFTDELASESIAESDMTTFSDASAGFDMAEFDEAFGEQVSAANNSSSPTDAQALGSIPRSEKAIGGSAVDESVVDESIVSENAFDSFPAVDSDNFLSEADDDSFEGISFEPQLSPQTEEKTLFMVDDDLGANTGRSGASPAVSAAAIEPKSTAVDPSRNDSISHDSAFADSFDDFDDFEDVPDFELSDSSVGFTNPSMASQGQFGGMEGDLAAPAVDELDSTDGTGQGFTSGFTNGFVREQSSSMPIFNKRAVSNPKPRKQGVLAPLENASMMTKRLVLAGSAGILSIFTVGMVGLAIAPSSTSVPGQRGSAYPIVASGMAGLVSFGSVFGLGYLVDKRTEETVQELQERFNQISQGDLNARATIFTRDEFGRLSEGFNQMASAISTTTGEAQRKAQEQEQAKEDLQRQVIRLLDDVEGAARGDLTVKAEVTADVLGAVADSFNLTIENLREIVKQVSVAARQVSQGSTENEKFARSLSADALRQAEELAVTLNSVQVMT